MTTFRFNELSDAPEQSQPTLAAAQQKYGFLPNLMKGLSESPAALNSYGMDPSVIAPGFAVLVGIDPILDMPRTGVNILGTMATACLVSRWQGGTALGDAARVEGAT